MLVLKHFIQSEKPQDMNPPSGALSFAKKAATPSSRSAVFVGPAGANALLAGNSIFVL